MVDVNVHELLRSLPYQERAQVAKLIYEDIPVSVIELELDVHRGDFINWRRGIVIKN